MGIETTTVKDEKEGGLKALRERGKHLQNRLRALQGETEAAKTRERGAAALLEQSQSALREGGGDHGAVLKAGAEWEEAKRTGAVLAAALSEVQAETADVECRIQEQEDEAERARQQKAAGPLQEKAEACVRDFLDGIARLRGPLEERHRLAVQLRSEFPRAGDVPRVRLDALAHAVREAAGGQNLLVVRHWVEVLLAGPGETLSDGRLEGLHLQR